MSPRRRFVILAGALAGLVAAAYGPALRAGFVFDDHEYLVTNVRVAAGLSRESVAWALTTFHAANWHPLTWLSHLLDVSLFGLEPRGHHAVNLLLHAANAILAAHVLRRLTGSFAAAALAAALFALHPLHVESVAWVAERKDLLSTLFLLLGLEAYRRGLARAGRRRLLPVAVLLALGLAAKPMLVTFPFLLLVLDWWPFGRWGPGPAAREGRGRAAPAGRLLAEKLPLFALVAASSVVTLLAQRAWGALAPLERHPFAWRLGNAAVAYVRYLLKTVWPADLAVFYPHPPGGSPPALVLAALAGLAAVSLVAARAARSRPWLAAGWLWYLGTLVPVIGLVQAGSQAIADRYTYLPLLGVFLAASLEVTAPRRRLLPPALAGGAALLGLAVLVALTRRQAGVWADQRTLFEHALAVTEGNWMAHYNLGLLEEKEGRGDAALAHYRAALRASPLLYEANINLGNALLARGDVAGGIVYLRQALASRPGSAEARVDLGVALARQGRPGEAIAMYRDALRLEPDMVEGYMNIGNVLSDLGRHQEALSSYAQALRLGPGRADVHFNVGLALERTGRFEEAVRSYREALRLRPDFPEARLGLARLGARP